LAIDVDRAASDRLHAPWPQSVQGEREEQLLEFAFGHGLITVSGVASHAFSQSIPYNR
jgi:hypothetical protein